MPGTEHMQPGLDTGYQQSDGRARPLWPLAVTIIVLGAALMMRAKGTEMKFYPMHQDDNARNNYTRTPRPIISLTPTK